MRAEISNGLHNSSLFFFSYSLLRCEWKTQTEKMIRFAFIACRIRSKQLTYHRSLIGSVSKRTNVPYADAVRLNTHTHKPFTDWKYISDISIMIDNFACLLMWTIDWILAHLCRHTLHFNTTQFFFSYYYFID